MMAALATLQACNRCRQKRIKCDHLLPSCKNCEQAFSECLFFDDTLQQEIPRAYLAALQKRIYELDSETKDLTKELEGFHSSAGSTLVNVDAGYFLDLSEIPVWSHVGPGSSARIIDQLLGGLVEWLTVNRPTSSATHFSSILDLSMSIDQTYGPRLSPLYDYQEIESLPTIAVSTQKYFIEHYQHVIHSKYPLLSADQNSLLAVLDNPMDWCTVNTHLSDGTAFLAVFAISSAHVARDIDAIFSGTAGSLGRYLRNIAHKSELSPDDFVSASSQKITVLCYIAILELVHPMFGDIWNIVGTAISRLEQLRADLHLIPALIDDGFKRIELCLLKLESSLAIHFRRPSQISEMLRIVDARASDSALDVVSNPSAIYSHLLKIGQGFATNPIPSQEYFESLIPLDLRVLVDDLLISPASATLYLALHPLFTNSVSEIFSKRALDEKSMKLFRIVANSAAKVIEGFVRLEREHRIISLWRSAERVLEAGAVWASYVIKLHLVDTVESQNTAKDSSSFGPLLKCNTLLASFAQRWKAGSIYSQIWETFLQVLWGLLEK